MSLFLLSSFCLFFSQLPVFAVKFLQQNNYTLLQTVLFINYMVISINIYYIARIWWIVVFRYVPPILIPI